MLLLRNHQDDSDNRGDNDDGDLRWDHKATIDGDGRHDYNAHGGNGHDEARKGNRDDDINCPYKSSLYYLEQLSNYPGPVAWTLIRFPCFAKRSSPR